MPIYEYRCRACGHDMEAFQRLSDEVLTLCPHCGAEALEKRVSAAGFRLKGGGWYETDFKSGQDKKKNLAGAEPADKSKAGSAPKTESPAKPSGTGSTET